MPKSRLEYWEPKLDRNKERDRRQEEQLRPLGWSVLVIWQCEMADLETLAVRLQDFLGSREARAAAGEKHPGISANVGNARV